MPKMPKGALEISGENLEDLLAYDDLFLDYFNCFLALPVFPQALVYNRLTGAFDEVEGLRPELMGNLPTISPSLNYGPTDFERERMLEWAREERLPLFLRTQLFRELKLVKLLLRPLEIERQSASRGSSRNIRGYSRATESYISSLSVSGDHSGNDIYDYDDIWGELNYSALYRYQRPGSRALSLPTRVFLDNNSYGLPSTIGSASSRSSDQSSLKALSAVTSRRFGAASTVQFAEFPEKPPEEENRNKRAAVAPSTGKTTETARQKARISNKVEVIPTTRSTVSKRDSSYKSKPPPSSTEEAFLRGARVLSAPVNYEQYLKMPRLDIHDFEALFGEPEPELDGRSFVQFDEEGVSEEQTETDMRNMEGRLKMTIQQVKEKMIGSHGGFEDFKNFLQGTMGEDLLAFWLDCENFKDTMEDFDDIENMEIRNAHFRDIQDKYKLKLTPDARDQVVRAASNMGLSHTIFLRTQYDVLRRLRAYWMPRFLIHCEMTKQIGDDGDTDRENLDPNPQPFVVQKSLPAPPPLPKQATDRSYLPFFPCISLVHSMPVLPEDARDYATALLMNVQYDNSSASLRRMFPRQRSNLSAANSRASTPSTRNNKTTIRTTKERFVLALASDRLAGGPFQRYLARLEDPQPLASLLFWEDVTEYGSTEDHSSDRLLRLCHAWNIYNKYLSEDSPHRIILPEKEMRRLQASLEKARDFMESSVFDNAKVLAVEKLEKAWIRYLKEDLKMFLDCRVKPGGESPPSTAEAIDITVTEYDVIIERPRPWVRRHPASTSSERARRLNRALIHADENDLAKRAQKKAEALARRKEMERERRKAIRAAYARQREAKKKPTTSSAHTRLDEELPEGEDGELGGERSSRVPTFQDMVGNRQVMSMFRKHVTEGENKDIHNMMQLYNEVESYFALKDGKAKKEAQAGVIAKNYLDPAGKKYTSLNNEKVTARIAQEKDRPKSPLLREIQRTILPRVEEVFKDFITRQAEEFGMEPSDLATMSQSELAMRMGNDQAMMSGWNKRKSRGKTTGRAQASRDDKNEFLAALSQSAMGHLSIKMLYFYKYLLKHGEEDGMPQIDKDLFFYIEVQKFKDGSHANSDDEMLKRKVQSIVDCFLDSVYSPTLQIDIPSDMHQKTLKATQRYLAGKETTPTLFDDAQFHVFKELLFYWAGYKRANNTPEDHKKRPVTKYEKMLRKRMENIQNYQVPSSDFTLPSIPEGAIPSFTISLSEGVKFKEVDESISGTPLPEATAKTGPRGSKAQIPEVDGLAKRSRGHSRRSSVIAK